MADFNVRQSVISSWHKHEQNKKLLDRSEEAEKLIVKMKEWCDKFLKNVRQHFRLATIRVYESQTEKMKHMIEKCERDIQAQLILITNEAVRADDVYNFDDPDTIHVSLGIIRHLADYTVELTNLLSIFFGIMEKFNEFKARVEEECRQRKSSFKVI